MISTSIETSTARCSTLPTPFAICVDASATCSLTLTSRSIHSRSGASRGNRSIASFQRSASITLRTAAALSTASTPIWRTTKVAGSAIAIVTSTTARAAESDGHLSFATSHSCKRMREDCEDERPCERRHERLDQLPAQPADQDRCGREHEHEQPLARKPFVVPAGHHGRVGLKPSVKRHRTGQSLRQSLRTCCRRGCCDCRPRSREHCPPIDATARLTRPAASPQTGRQPRSVDGEPSARPDGRIASRALFVGCRLEPRSSVDETCGGGVCSVASVLTVGRQGTHFVAGQLNPSTGK